MGEEDRYREDREDPSAFFIAFDPDGKPVQLHSTGWFEETEEGWKEITDDDPLADFVKWVETTYLTESSAQEISMDHTRDQAPRILACGSRIRRWAGAYLYWPRRPS